MKRVVSIVLMGMGGLFALLCVLFWIGSALKKPTSSDAQSTGTPEANTPEPLALHQATFRDGRLDMCTDLSVTPAVGQEEAAAAKVAVAAQIKDLPDQSRTEVISRPCLDQFSERTALASCRVEIDGATGHVRAEAHYYDYATVGDGDSYMQECLSRHGDWHSADAHTLRSAKLEAHLRKLQKTLASER